MTQPKQPKPCDATWRSTRLPLIEEYGRYRQHRCGLTGPHLIHRCRYCEADR